MGWFYPIIGIIAVIIDSSNSCYSWKGGPYHNPTNLPNINIIVPDPIGIVQDPIGIVQDPTGRLRIGRDAVEQMIVRIRDGASNSGGPTSFFKRVVPRELDQGDPREETVHHIIPRAAIAPAILESYQQDAARVREDLEAYINLPAIRQIFQTNFLDMDNRYLDGSIPLRTPDQAGYILFIAVHWLPTNLVRGPAPRMRNNDPGSGLDEELLGVQTPEYQAAARRAWDAINPNNNRPTNFGEFVEALKELTVPRVRWEKGQNGKYYAINSFVHDELR